MVDLAARRVLVYGVTGSGKTTVARQLSRITGLPWYSVDDLMWQPGWVQLPRQEQIRRMSAICAGDRWILDAAYGAWESVVLQRAELVVALDLPRWLSMWQLLRRTLRRLVSREEICNGNRESLRLQLGRDSLLLWHMRSFRVKRRRIEAMIADPDGPEVIRLRRRREVNAWLASLANA